MEQVLGLEVEASSGRRDRNEQILLDVVGKEVSDRINQSLHRTILLTLGKGDPTFPTALPRQGKLHLADGNHQALYAEVSIGDLFDQPTISGRLLIVGPTGIGKTTALLELAAELVQQTKLDPEQPIPVLFHLSSWPVEQQSFEEWLRTEMGVKYGVSKKLSNLWLETNTLLPLLDGLDELPTDHQESAVQQINEWLVNSPRSLVVCCGYEDGDRASIPLTLNGILELEPLIPEHLEKYLAALGLDTLWTKRQPTPEILDLIRTPLGLSLLILTRDTLDFATWETLSSPQDRQNHLLDSFILQQLHQPLTANFTDKSQPTAQQTRHWLEWLARHINEQSEHEFLIENMQPHLLRNRKQIIQYSVLGGLIFGLMGGIVFGLFVGPGSGLFVAFMIAALFIARRGDDAIATIDVKPTTASLMQFIFVRQLNPLLFFLAVAVILVAFKAEGIGSFIFLLGMVLLVGVLVRLTFALPSWLMGSFASKINRFLEADIAIRTKPNQTIQETLLYILRTTVMFLPILIAIRITPLFWSGKLAGPMALDVPTALHIVGVSAAIALWATIFDSALACAQHLALRLVLFKANAIPWHYARFLNHCCDRHLLQRVGGRYQFIHRLVQERFATMP